MGDGRITSENAREYQARGVAKRKQNIQNRKTFAEYANAILAEDGTYKGETVTKKQLIMLKALRYLIEAPDEMDAREFFAAFRDIRDTIGEKPTEKVEIAEREHGLNLLEQMAAEMTDE